MLNTTSYDLVRRLTIRPLLLALLLLVSCGVWQADAADEFVPAQVAHSATDAVKHTITELLRILDDPAMKQPDQSDARRQAIERIIMQRVSYEEMAKRSLGTPWTELSETDRREFVELFVGAGAARVRDLARARGWTRVLLVTSPSHSRRAAALFRSQGVTVVSIPAQEWRFDQALTQPSDRLVAHDTAPVNALFIAMQDAVKAGDNAVALGVDHRRLLTRVLVLVAVLVSVSTALVGPVTFLGLLVANLAYRVMPTYRHAYVLPAAALITAVTLVGGQLVLERVFALNAALSIVIEFLGGLTLLVLLARRAR